LSKGETLNEDLIQRNPANANQVYPVYLLSTINNSPPVDASERPERAQYR